MTDVWETMASHEKTAVEQKKQIVGKSDRTSTASVFLYVCVYARAMKVCVPQEHKV